MRGQVEPVDLGAAEFCSVTAGAFHSCCAADCAADAGLSLAVIPCGAQEPRQCRLELGK